MKKTILQTLGLAFAIGALLTSCLGDNNSSFTNRDTLTYVKEMDYGMTRVGIPKGAYAFSHNYLNKLEVGRFYYLDFEVNTKDGTTSNGMAYIASSAGPGTSGTKPVIEGVFDYGEAEPQTEVYPSSNINISFYSPSASNGLDDKWVFAYEANVYKEDLDPFDDPNDPSNNNIQLHAMILNNDQKIQNGEVTNELPKNHVVVRLFLKRRQPVNPSSKETVVLRGTASIDLRALRSRLLMSEEFTQQKIGLVQFKYYKANSKNVQDTDPSFTPTTVDATNPQVYLTPDNQ